MEYDEQKAVEFIRTKLPASSSQEYDDDEILNVVDMIWDYYDENGFLDLDLDDDGPDELDINDLLSYVKKMIAKDRNSPLSIKDAEIIVKAELDYEDMVDAE